VQIKPGSNTATINWETDELAAGKILFGTHSSMYNNQIYEGVLGTEHGLTLQGLLGNTTYYFQIVEKDPSGNESQSREYSFRTGAFDPDHGGGDDGGHGGHHGNNDDDNGNDNNGNNNDNHGGGNDNHNGRGEGY
jgi:hypothetical protein